MSSILINKLNTKKLPDSPGVYFFKKGSKILYIGKATSLKSRVKSYFSGQILDTRGPWIAKMLEEATSVDFKKTDSVLEALLLESALIKKHQPLFNTREKDDKSYWYVIITDEDYPRVLPIRQRELITAIDPSDVKYSFGPFPQGTELKEALKIIRKIFPFRDKCKPGQSRPCFNSQIGLCPGICSGHLSKTEYRRQIQNIRLLFEGKKGSLVKKLEKEMRILAKERKFERASELKSQIFSLNHIRDISLIKDVSGNFDDGFRIEAYDIAHMSGKNTVGVMTVIIGSVPAKSEYRRFKLQGTSANKVNDTANLAEIINRRLKHTQWSLPKLVVIDGGKAQLNVAIDKFGSLNIPVVGVVKDEHHRPKEIIGDKNFASKYSNEILLANAEAHRFAINYHKKVRRKII